MERYHAKLASELLIKSGLLHALPSDVQQNVLDSVSQLVLQTDMMSHDEVLEAIRSKLWLPSGGDDEADERQESEDEAPAAGAAGQDATDDDDASEGKQEPQNRWDVSTTSSHPFLLALMLKCADISNVVKPFHIARKWAKLLFDEFHAASARERALGIQVTKPPASMRSMTVGFITFVARKTFEFLAQVFPETADFLETLEKNVLEWEQRPSSPAKAVQFDARETWPPKDTSSSSSIRLFPEAEEQASSAAAGTAAEGGDSEQKEGHAEGSDARGGILGASSSLAQRGRSTSATTPAAYYAGTFYATRSRKKSMESKVLQTMTRLQRRCNSEPMIQYAPPPYQG